MSKPTLFYFKSRQGYLNHKNALVSETNKNGYLEKLILINKFSFYKSSRLINWNIHFQMMDKTIIQIIRGIV